MTVSVETNKVTYACDGEKTSFDFEFKVFSEDDIAVAVVADGVETILEKTTDYTVAGENGAFANGGTVNTVKEVGGEMVAYAWPEDYTLVISLDVDISQPTDLPRGGSLPSAAVELALDRLTKIAQMLALLISNLDGRVIKLPVISDITDNEIPDPDSATWLYFNGTNFAWASNIDTGEATVTDFAKTLLDDANAAAFLTTLGISAFIQTLLDDATALAARQTLKVPLRTVFAAKTAAYTVQASDDGVIIPVDATEDNIVIALPAIADLWTGFTFGLKKVDSGSNYVEADPDATETIDGSATYTLLKQNDAAIFVLGPTEWKMTSNGVNNLTTNRLLLGAGAGSISPMTAMTNGQLVVGQTGGPPLPKTISGQATITNAGVVTVLPTLAAGDILLISANTERTTNETDYTTLKDIQIARFGEYKIYYETKGDGKINIFKGDDAVGTERTIANGTYAGYTENISGFTAGDNIRIKAKKTGGTMYVRYFRIYANFFGETVVTD